MDIYLAAEHAYHLVPQIAPDIARDRVEQKKANLVAGTVGALLSRPKPEEIQLISMENRLEPFWLITIFTRTGYDRNRTFTVTVSGPEVKRVTVLGQEVPVTMAAPQKSGLAGLGQEKPLPSFSLAGLEQCVEETRLTRMFDGLSGQPAEMSKYTPFAKTEIADINAFAPEGVLVVPPQVRATAVVRQVMAEAVKSIQHAQVIHEERVEVEVMDVNFRPVYAFEYEWAAKGKRMVIEFDALTGDIHGGGKKWNDQIKGMLTRDLLFDVTADAVGMIVPGGGIAVKLVKAVVDRGK